MTLTRPCRHPHTTNTTPITPITHRQSIAAEMNLSETAFLQLPEGHTCDSFTASPSYNLRWFTPTMEVPLCGHATLAAAAALFHGGCTYVCCMSVCRNLSLAVHFQYARFCQYIHFCQYAHLRCIPLKQPCSSTPPPNTHSLTPPLQKPHTHTAGNTAPTLTFHTKSGDLHVARNHNNTLSMRLPALPGSGELPPALQAALPALTKVGMRVCSMRVCVCV